MNTFQAVITSDGSETYVLFLYRDIQWTSFIGAVAGFNAGDNMRFFNLPETFTSADDITGRLNLEETSNVALPGVYIFRVDQNAIIQPLGMWSTVLFSLGLKGA